MDRAARVRALLFGLLCAVFSPLLLVGLVVFAFKVRFVNMPRGISTALDVDDVHQPPHARGWTRVRLAGRGTPIGGLIVAAV